MDLSQWKKYFSGRPGLDALVARTSAPGVAPIFMVGSGLSLPAKPGDPGVPGAQGMIDLVRERVRDDQAALDDLKRSLARPEGEGVSAYGAAFEFLGDWRGPDAVNTVIRNAVLMARLSGARQSDDPAVLEQDVEGWALRPGTRALGFLLSGYPQSYPGPVLTTNFDPLLSVAINRAHGRPRRAIVDGDGRLPSRAELEPNEMSVIHLHGYWRGSDTHHTGMELTAPRPQLGASLARLLNQRLVVVVGYAGWDDAFMRALSSLLDDTGARPDIAWALYEDEPGKIFDRYGPLMDHFDRWRSRSRFTLYKGIDANEFFQRLLDRAIGSRGPVDPMDGPPAPALADRLHRTAALFDGFMKECAGERKVPGDSRARLLAQLVDLREALRPLGDAELKAWPDTGFAVEVRAPRNRAGELITRVQQALSRREDPGAELSQLVAALTGIRDLIRDRMPAAAAQPARSGSPRPSQPGP
jgi:SIR2-like domain